LRGGTGQNDAQLPAHQGLSPLARGNPSTKYPAPAAWGSIPACAGEPPRLAHGDGLRGVYPRLRGGTAALLTCSHL